MRQCKLLLSGDSSKKRRRIVTILAFQKVLERLPEAKLVMIGTGILQDMCCQLIKALHIEYAVELKGVIAHDRIAALMQQSRVFVQHSLTPASGDSEGTPVAIVEAGATGLPVVSTRHAGISDVIVEGKTGFLVAEGDINAMANCIYELLSSPARAGQMGKNAREHIAKNFDMDCSIKNLRKILQNYSS